MGNLDKLLRIMRTLRAADGGCEWDRRQTFRSLVPHTLEEAYEVVEAIECGETADIADELGDLLFQIVFYCRIAEESELFDFETVAHRICEKLVRRHPLVFDPGALDRSAVDAREAAWEHIKAAERRSKQPHATSLLDGLCSSLPAAIYAKKLQQRVAPIGFDWNDVAAVFGVVSAELDELREAYDQSAGPDKQEEEFGDLLFACVNLGRHLGFDPEGALRRANRKFARRFKTMEKLCEADGADISAQPPSELERLWAEAKNLERSS